MRRLITVFFLTAALFVLMGCGAGSKEAPQHSVEKKIFTLPLGEYIGTEGNELYADNVELDIINELYALRTQRDGYWAEANKIVADYEAMTDSLKAHDALADDARAEDHDEMSEAINAELKSLGDALNASTDVANAIADQIIEDGVVQRSYDRVESSIAYNEESGQYELHNFTLKYKLNGEKKAEKPLGDVINISFNKETGEVSFSELLDEGHASIHFNGQISEKMNDDKKQTVLSGMGWSFTRDDNTGEETVTHFALNLVYQTPVVEEATTEEEEKTEEKNEEQTEENAEDKKEEKIEEESEEK